MSTSGNRTTASNNAEQIVFTGDNPQARFGHTITLLSK